MKIAIYVRVSTADQNQDLQLRELQDYAARHQWEISQVYQDVISGASVSRPGLNELMDDARARKLDIVLCWKLDRFGRRSETASTTWANWTPMECDSSLPRRVWTPTAGIQHHASCSTCSESRPSLNGG